MKGPPPNPRFALRVPEGDTTERYVCGDCGHGLGPVTENYKLAAATLRSDPSAVHSATYPDPTRFCEDKFEFRQALCPSCAAGTSAASTTHCTSQRNSYPT